MLKTKKFINLIFLYGFILFFIINLVQYIVECESSEIDIILSDPFHKFPLVILYALIVTLMKGFGAIVVFIIINIVSIRYNIKKLDINDFKKTNEYYRDIIKDIRNM